MAIAPTNSAAAGDDTHQINAPGLNYFVFALFFIFGGITSLNDVILPKLKELFTLSFTEAMLVQFCFFTAYLVIGIPGAALVKRLGYMKGAVAGLVEKPSAAQAPSRLASMGRYVLEPQIFDILRAQKPGHGGEIQLADAIHVRAQQGFVRSVALNGKRYDCGSKMGYLEAIVAVALRHPDFRDRFGALIRREGALLP